MWRLSKRKKEKGIKSIKTKISLSIELPVLFVALIISVAVTITISNNITKNNEANLVEYTEVAGQRISSVLSNFKTAALIVASNPIVSDTSAEFDSRFAQLAAAGEMLEAANYGITNADGINMQTKKDISNMDYFQYAKQNNTSYVSSPIVYETNNGMTSVIMISAPIIENGTFAGVVFFGIDGEVLHSYVNDTVYGKTGVCSIIDSKGMTIASPNYDLVLEKYSSIETAKNNPEIQPLADLHTKQMNGEKGLEYFSYSGVKYLATYQPIEISNGWNINVIYEYSEMMEPVRISLISIFVVVIAALLVCIIFSIKMTKSISVPINQCVTRLGKVVSGDLNSPVPVVNSNDEIGVLSLSTKELVEGLSNVVKDITNVLNELSAGNLNVTFDKKYDGDFVPMQNATNKIIASLNYAMNQIGKTSDKVAVSSSQVSNGAQALSQGTTEQASSVEELGATINEISQQVKMNAQNAQQASSKANTVGAEAKDSNDRMQHMLEAMSDISNSSNEIGKIIKTIEDISFQTNILALNAAVEAARAGAAGKGFAVVADEVRNLANKSSEASKSTSVLIENSLRAVENGSKIADETATSLVSVVRGITEVTTIIEKISNASSEQSQSIIQVSQGVEQISNVVQTNSATAEESAAASEELSNLAQNLKKLVSNFSLKENQDSMDFQKESHINHSTIPVSSDSVNTSLEDKY